MVSTVKIDNISNTGSLLSIQFCVCCHFHLYYTPAVHISGSFPAFSIFLTFPYLSSGPSSSFWNNTIALSTTGNACDTTKIIVKLQCFGASFGERGQGKYAYNYTNSWIVIATASHIGLFIPVWKTSVSLCKYLMWLINVLTDCLNGMYLQTASYCLVACASPWMEFVGQHSLFGVRYDEHQTVTTCQDYCITLPTCVAIDFSMADNVCWLHFTSQYLSIDTTFSHDGTNQYRLDRSCLTTTSG